MRDACYVLRSLAMVLGEQEEVLMKVPMIVAAYSETVGLKIIGAASIEVAERAFKRFNRGNPPDWAERIPQCCYGAAKMLQRLGWRGSRNAFIWEMRRA